MRRAREVAAPGVGPVYAARRGSLCGCRNVESKSLCAAIVAVERRCAARLNPCGHGSKVRFVCCLCLPGSLFVNSYLHAPEDESSDRRAWPAISFFRQSAAVQAKYCALLYR